jgi:hypothetical protein
MAWPDDARYKNYAANSQVKSAELNEFQDQIYANHANITDLLLLTDVKYNIFRNALPDSVNYYSYVATDAGYWAPKGSMTGVSLTFECAIPHDAHVSEIVAKVYNGDSSAHDWTVTAYLADMNFETSDGEPALGAAVGSQTTSIASTEYGTITYTPVTPFQLDTDDNADHNLVVLVGPCYHDDDRIYGIRVEYYPIGT